MRTGADASASIELAAVVREARRRGVDFPALIRFPDILRAQVERLHRVFRTAMDETGYENAYRCVYPVKVNPLQQVVGEILDAGREYGMGLECGSKAELAAALPHLEDDRTLLVCNGVQDRAMLSLMLDAQQLGKNVIPVVEKIESFSELKSLAGERNIAPRFGARIRLTTEGSGRWAGCSGPNSKFGLPIAELVRLLEELRADALLHRLELLHCHPGSQVADLGVLQRAVREAAQVYASLVKGGVGLRYLDVGGGLGVNYGEAGSGPGVEVGYGMQEYAGALVAAVKEVCDGQRVPVPILITESGRAITAHHSVLIVPVLGAREREGLAAETRLPRDAREASRTLFGLARQDPGLRSGNEALALFPVIREKRRELQALFAEGRLPLEELAVTDRAYWSLCRGLLKALRDARLDPPPELEALEGGLADRVLCDFSVFRSMLDHWAIGQPFPIMPIEHLDERPARRGVLVDLTCDSDGQVNRYVSSDRDKTSLPVHSLRPGIPAYLGVFLMGAYEDIMGDAHNLFGRVSEVHVRADESGRFGIENVIPATTVEEMLAQMQYFSDDLRRRMSGLVGARIEAGALRPAAGDGMVDRYTACLRQGTYCETSPGPGAGEALTRPEPVSVDCPVSAGGRQQAGEPLTRLEPASVGAAGRLDAPAAEKVGEFG